MSDSARLALRRGLFFGCWMAGWMLLLDVVRGKEVPFADALFKYGLTGLLSGVLYAVLMRRVAPTRS